MTTRYISSGTQLAFIGRVDDTGKFAGISGDVAAGLAGEGMYHVLGIQTANPGPVEPETVNIAGDDTTLGAVQFPPNETPQWVMQVGAFDLTLQSLLQGTAVLDVNGIQMGVLQPNGATMPDVCLIYQAKSKSKDAATDGASIWSGYVVPRANCYPLGRAEFAGRQAANDRYQIVAQLASMLPFGVTIQTSTLGTTGAPLIPFTSDNPITMHRFLTTAAAGPYQLAYRPIAQAKTRIVHVTQNTVYVPGADYTVDAVSRTVTFTPALPANTPIVVLYEFDPGS